MSDSLIQHGLAAHRIGDLEAARRYYEQALQADAENADALYLLGTALLQLGHPEHAVVPLERAARKMRGRADAFGSLAQAYAALGHHEPAREAFRKASQLDPGNVHYRVGISTALMMMGKLAEAEGYLRKQVRSFSKDASVWFNLGNVLRDLGRPTDACDCFAKALALDSHRVDVRNNLAGVLRALGRFGEAEREFRECIAADPDSLLPHCNLATLLLETGRFGEAETLLQSVVERAPDLVEAHNWLGMALTHQGRIREALPCYRTAAELAPDRVEGVLSYAEVLIENGCVQEGLRWFARALSLDQSAQVRAGLADALLAAGMFGEGWRNFANRPWALQFREQHPDLRLAVTLPDSLDGKEVLLLREQGLGDEIFFLRFANELRARGARVSYRASGKLRSLLAGVDFLDHALAEDDLLSPADVTLLIGDLPQALFPLPASAVPADTPSADSASAPNFNLRIAVFWPEVPTSIELRPKAERIAEIRNRLARAGPPPYLGITWRAGTPPIRQTGEDWVLHKAIPLQHLAGAVRGFRGTVIALQRFPDTGELAELSEELGNRVHDFTPLNEDLEGMLALLSIIDEYVGVSNTNMHLRAATGRAARVLVPCPAEWRWMVSGSTSPWFPAFSIYRQSPHGTWDDALKRLSTDLENSHAGTTAMPPSATSNL